MVKVRAYWLILALSKSCWRSQLVAVFRQEYSEGFLCMFEMFCRFPGWVVVASPLDKILKLAMMFALVQDCFDKIFLLIIDDF